MRAYLDAASISLDSICYDPASDTSITLICLRTSFFRNTQGDDDKEESEDKEEGDKEEGDDEEEEEEEEDEDEPEDPAPAIYEECEKSKACAPLKHHFDECTKRVNEGKGFEGENCIEEFCKWSFLSPQTSLFRAFLIAY